MMLISTILALRVHVHGASFICTVQNYQLIFYSLGLSLTSITFHK